MPKVIQALLIQLLALLFLAVGVWVVSRFIAPPFADCALLAAQALLALLLSALFRLSRWWWLIQFVFPFLMYFALHSGVNPLIGLALFALVWILFRNAFVERVPLYLSNSTARRALAQLAQESGSRAFIDLGCGLGANVVFMSRQPAVEHSVGVETAPLPLLLSKLRSLAGGTVLAQDIWRTDLSQYDLVYAFLSPQPMPRLWQKLLEELPENAVFVSNSFTVPGIEPSEIWSLNDRRQTQFYIYKMSGFKMEAKVKAQSEGAIE